MTLLEAVEDAVARIVFAREAVELAELDVAAHVLRDLEADLVAVLEQARRREAA